MTLARGPTAGHRRVTTLLGTTLLVSPVTALAATAASFTVQTTDPAGDAHEALLQPNVAAADLLTAGVRVTSSTVTFFFDLTTAPTQADFAKGSYGYQGELKLSVPSRGYDTIEAEIFTPEDGGAASGYVGVTDSSQTNPESDPHAPTLVGAVALDAGANELTVTVKRADLNANIAQLVALIDQPNRQLVAGVQLQYTDASSSAPSTYFLSNTGSDGANAGPTVTFTG